MTQQADALALALARRHLKPDQDRAQLKPANDAGADDHETKAHCPRTM